jgi:ribulose 1,5-bisphosphate carboxylase large subunit-like protein
VNSVFFPIPVREYAKEHKELGVALGLFGIGKKTEFTSV